MSSPRGLLVDIDGVLVVSWRAVPGAVDALRRLRAADIPVRFITNTTSRTRVQIAEALQEAGFDIQRDEVITAAQATATYLNTLHPGARCLVINSGDIRSDLAGVTVLPPDADPEDVDVVVLGGAGSEFTYPMLNKILTCLLRGAALIAIHRNVVWRTDAGLQLDTGAFLAGLEAASGKEATIIGKPSAEMFRAGLEELGLPAEDVAMVGDDIDSDVRGAQDFGLTGVQVRTGKFREEQLSGGIPPQVMLDSFADIALWLEMVESDPES